MSADQQLGDVAHVKLSFNGMVLTISDRIEQCRKDTRFWMPLENTPQFEMFLKVNQIEKIDNRKTFGILVASRIVLLRR